MWNIYIILLIQKLKNDFLALIIDAYINEYHYDIDMIPLSHNHYSAIFVFHKYKLKERYQRYSRDSIFF